nr:putative ribonuclease H-like domain-containing protein [Tanacetum cinerariifolium]
MSYLTNFEEINGGYVSFGGNPKGGKISDPQNTDGDATFVVKEPEFEGRKPESEVHVSPSSSAKIKKHDDKTKREAKGKIPTIGQISANSTNTFSAAGPSNTAISPTLRESSYINNEDFHTCMFACFLSQEEPKRVRQALKDPSCIKAMQEELLQFMMQKVWVLVDLPNGKKAIGFEDPDYPDKVYKVVK